ncbi:MAG: MATE family efflux transporter [Candidatus Solibacter sp.]|nr:MATE family efflux transporter [Candidatus Solibacter sp.]
MVLEMCMESLFGIVDIFWVARLGSHAAAGVGLTESLMAILYAVAMGVSMATTAMIARRTGEKNPDGASTAAAQAILLGLALSALISVPGFIFGGDLLRLMGADSGVLASATGYAQVIFGSSLSVMLLFLMNAIFRGAGDAAVAMRVLWVANAINIVLDPLLIFGIGPFPALGITGAAWATAIGRSIGVAMQLWIFFSAGSRIRIAARHFRPHWKVLRNLSRISATGMVQFIIPHASWVALVRIIAISGAEALAGYTIAVRIIVFALLPSWGLSNAAATLVGQNLGARRPDRAESSVWRTGLYNVVFLASVGIVFVIAPAPVLRLFTSDAAVIAHGVECLRIISYGYPFYAFGMVLVQAFNGAGDTVTPTWLNLGAYWLFQIPLAWSLSQPLGLGATGAFWAVPAAESLLTLAALYFFRKGHWKLRKI